MVGKRPTHHNYDKKASASLPTGGSTQSPPSGTPGVTILLLATHTYVLLTVKWTAASPTALPPRLPAPMDTGYVCGLWIMLVVTGVDTMDACTQTKRRMCTDIATNVLPLHSASSLLLLSTQAAPTTR